MVAESQGLMTGFGTPQQRPIHATTCEALLGHAVADGSMGPKVRAAVGFVRATGRRASIGSLDDARAVVNGDRGTQVNA